MARPRHLHGRPRLPEDPLNRSARPNQRLAAYGLLRRDGAVLLCRAAPRTATPGAWWLPGGGVEFGEHPEATVVREVAEETGLVVSVGPLVTILDDIQVQSDRSQVHTVRLIYRAEVLGGTLAAEINGTTDLAVWVEDQHLAGAPLAPYVRAALEAD